MPRTYVEITKDQQLQDFCRSLSDRGVKILAMDFEGEFNLHVYGERLCLIQVYDGSDFYLVDPIGLSKETLATFFSVKDMVYMFYSADSDMSLVFKQYGIRMRSVYDLQLLVDLLDLPSKGLDGVLASELGVTVEKKKKFQRHNWTLRPIEEEAKQYALNDVAYLFTLHEVLLAKIKKGDLVESLAFKLVSSVKDYDKKTVPGIFKTNEYKKMNRAGKAAYERIVGIREACAEELDVPAHLVIPKHDLAGLAEDPLRIRNLRFHDRVPRTMRERIVREVSAVVRA